MTDPITLQYCNHYLRQIEGSNGGKLHIQSPVSPQQSGIGLGNMNSVTTRYLIPASVNARKSRVSLGVKEIHDRTRRKKKKPKAKKRQVGGRMSKRKRKRKGNQIQNGGRKRKRVYKGKKRRARRRSKKKRTEVANQNFNF